MQRRLMVPTARWTVLLAAGICSTIAALPRYHMYLCVDDFLEKGKYPDLPEFRTISGDCRHGCGILNDDITKQPGNGFVAPE